MSQTKKCEVCEAEIGSTETVCPACKADFAELEAEVQVVTRAQTVLAKRKAKEVPPTPVVAPTSTPAKKSIFASLRPKG